MRRPKLETFVFVLVALLSAWRLWRAPHEAANLEIVPDSVEYAVAADRVASHQGYTLLIDGVTRPPRYPPWFSVGLLAPAIALAGGDIGAAILPVFVLGVAAVATAFAIGRHLAGVWGAAGASLALLLTPAFDAFSRVVMTDVPALAFALTAALLYLGLGTGVLRRSSIASAGLCAAAAAALRIECLAILLPFAWHIARLERRPAASLALLVTPSLALGAATAWYDAATFGSFSRTGYHYWCPVPYDFSGLTIGLRYVSMNLAGLLRFGSIAGLVLGATGAAVLLAHKRDSARRILTFFALAALPGTLLHLVYFYPRHAVPPVRPGAGLGARGCRARIAGGARRARSGVAGRRPDRSGGTASEGIASPALPAHHRGDARARDSEKRGHRVRPRSRVPRALPAARLAADARAASRSVEYASKLVAPTPLGPIDPPPRGATDHRAPGLVKAGAVDPCTIVATVVAE
jgi:hypothetical protein